MSLKHATEYRDPKISRALVEQIKRISRKDSRLMEVCGTHTMSIFKSGIRSLLPPTLALLSGPGCPVCVTAQGEIDAFIDLARADDVILTTFGDLMRVPGTRSSLQKELADGRDVRIVYSTFDALDIARKNPDKQVVFLGVGFETTAPTIAAAILSAGKLGLENFSVFSAHKLTLPAISALISSPELKVDGFLLPGHVSVITGSKIYRPLVALYRIPCVIAGFEPMDVLQAIYILIRQVESGEAKLENAYARAVTEDGNQKAQEVMAEVFETEDAEWRGLGRIAKSGLKIRAEYAAFDAQKQFEISVSHPRAPKGCACGEILKGSMTPPDCPLYKKACTPMDPVGPCMVSSEGTCAAYYRYHSS
jgi:hydrogenase expression/formation protein HypD